jgi:hypothetical protein
MLYLAGAAASGALDLVSSLRQAIDSGKSKTGKTAAAFATPAASQSSSVEIGGLATPTQPVSAGTMRLMLSLQAHGVDMSSRIFEALDADGSGDVSKSEFEQMFAKSGDTLRADKAFDKLDTDDDGAVSAKELAAGLKTTARSRDEEEGETTHKADRKGDGATTVTSADGSTTTTITYDDGSTVTMTRPATASSGTDKYVGNLLERLIQRQAEMLTTSNSGQSMAVSV